MNTKRVDFSSMTYPDLVAFMQQENTPPGASHALDYLIEASTVTSGSYLLDLACSTGFSSRYCYEQVGSRAVGIDTSSAAVSVANEKTNELNATDKLQYLVADACALPFENESFTHVLGGCNFGFIQDRQRALSECHRVLKHTGILCISNFFFRLTPPEFILNAVEKALGWRPEPSWTYDYWKEFFTGHGFTLGSEFTYELFAESEDALAMRVRRYLCQENPGTRAMATDQQEALYSHFFEIRKSLNAQKDFQGVAFQTWHK
ncbi:class I SAM-dependent methyltransferase [Pseudomonas sp. WC1]|uniref:class I SAM-dependent methyltransferase n=1 Tax=unclassified Pseudomonas TaxID=196821 RepID=UPI001C49956D|nr:class I SAM-dependent methyltransferase [Pseudomonas sp. F16(2018)]